MLPIVLAASDLEECQRVQQVQNVPCTIISSFKPAGGCGQEILIFTENGSFVQNQSWEDSIPFCQTTWNISSPLGTYVYNSTVEDGVITLEAQDNMLAIAFAFILTIAYFSIIGWVNSQKGRTITSFLSYFLGLVQLFMLIGLLWISEAGGSLIPILQLNFTIILILGGGLLLFTLFAKSLNMANITDVFDEDNKWETEKWVDNRR